MQVLVLARAQALLDRVVPLLRKEGVAALGTTSDEDAVARLEAGGVTALVIGGGVEPTSRERLRAAAGGTPVIDGALRGREAEAYVRDELVPALRRAAADAEPSR
jgi:hypothetical protein